ncbi:Fer2 domain-containing protein [Cephalotus follicularis]|uniref:Fer2 domain-containing protein n=1 Tax=Cephalotus follicularis TaxID=3775 RepID=A0A1Q3BP67_CEPFO|nr:Fer2 domain-containing protein [Cephalotus follicularis]
MDLIVPCNSCISLYRKPALHRKLPSTKSNPPHPSKCHYVTTSELQIPLEITGRTGNCSTSVPTHKVTVHDRQRGVVHEFLVPEDQYILHTAESQNITLPFACRHGCCTSCAVRVKSGQLRQPEALGISADLKSKGYALLCVGFPSSDLEVETQDEDEVYWLQFGRYFARGPVERDDYALELAMGDE